MSRLILLAVVGALALPSVAFACPNCIDAVEGSRMAFIVTTGILSFLPLMMIGGTVLFFRHRAREVAAQQLALLADPGESSA